MNVLHEVHARYLDITNEFEKGEAVMQEVRDILGIPYSVGVQDSLGEDDDLLKNSDQGDE